LEDLHEAAGYVTSSKWFTNDYARHVSA